MRLPASGRKPSDMWSIRNRTTTRTVPRPSDGNLPVIDFSRVPEGRTAKNRVHIDLEVAGKPPWDMVAREPLLRAKADELVAAGATRVREELTGEDLSHIVLLDPEGNEFCVA